MPKKYQDGKLEIRRDVGRQYYFVRLTRPVIGKNGKPRKARMPERLGFLDEISRDEAMRRRARALELVNTNRAVAPSIIRFSELANRYLETRVKQLGFATQNWERTQIKNHILPAFESMKLSEINRFAVESWLAERVKLSWWSRNGLKRILARMFNAAKEWQWLQGDNPVHGIRLGKKIVKYERKSLKIEEFRVLVSALNERVRFMVLIIFGLGLAISEVLGLKWKDIDFDEKTISIRRRWHRGNLSEEFGTKTEARSAVMRLSDSMVGEFASRYPGPHRRDEFLFVGDHGMPPDDRDIGREELRPVLKRLGLYTPGNLWHSFRRQNITWRQQIGGATPLEAMKAARHASLDMTLLYSLTDQERETAQQQAMFDALYGKPEGPKQ